MCYSLESSIRTSVLSLVSCIYLYTSGIAKFKWLSVSLLGWSAMQFAEAMLWYTEPNKKCTNFNKMITLTLIPFILVLQSIGSVLGSFYVIPWNTLSNENKLAYIIFFMIVIATIFNHQFTKINSVCTTVTSQGHLNWSTHKQFELTQHILVAFFMIGLPLFTLWENKSELLALFIIPIAGALYGLSTDSVGSVWCYYTSFSSIIFALKLYLFKKGINI